jgi:hypothetical protein
VEEAMKRRRWIGFAVLCLVAHSTVVGFADPFWLPISDNDDIAKAIARIEKLRKEGEVDHDRVQELCDSLLREFPDTKQQGLILFHVTNVFAQSGMRDRGLVLKYAAMSLESLADPPRRAALHVYCGDAIRLEIRKENAFEVRASSATWYLKGLKEIDEAKLPTPAEAPVALTRVVRPEEGLGDDIGGDELLIRQLAVAARQRAEAQSRRTEEQRFYRMMQFHKKVLVQQVVSLYKNAPYDRAQLEQLCQVLQINDESRNAILEQIPLPPAQARHTISILVVLNCLVIVCLLAVTLKSLSIRKSS